MADQQKNRAQPPRLAATVLDRLLDTDPDLAEDSGISQAETLTGLRESLRRDLGILMNTRCRPTSHPDGLRDLDNSLMTLGVDDFFNASLVTDQQRQTFAARIQARISRFETRLEDLSVEILPVTNADQRSLRMRISASYRTQPGMGPMAFETVLDPITHRFSLQDRRRDGQ